MEDRTSTTQKADVQARRIEPILDASGTLRRIPSDASKSNVSEDFQTGRNYNHPAR